jgi:hypothetical protein
MTAGISKLGSEFLVNTAITNSQFAPQITALANGDFVVTWIDSSQDGPSGDASGTAVRAQVLAPDGTRIGGEILINVAAANNQLEQQITALPNGSFVVTWTDFSSGVGGATGDGTSTAVKARVFAPTGTALSGELLVNTATAGGQGSPAVTSLSNGGFVVTWQDGSLGVGGATGDASVSAVKAQIYLANGTPVDSEILVNTATAGNQNGAQIRALAGGGFAVAWQDASHGVGGATGDVNGNAVKAQVFLADGTRVGSELLVNTATADDQDIPRMAALSNGGFVVTWRDQSLGVGGATGDGSGNAVKAQVFLADGTRVGSELLVNTATAGDQDTQQVAALPNGGFVVTWGDHSQGVGGASGDSSLTGVKGQVFLADGTRAGSEFLVNTATANSQNLPRIQTLSNDMFVVVWQDDSNGVGGAAGDGTGLALKGQVFLLDGTRFGSEFLINTATAGDQQTPQIALLPDGDFVVTWRDDSLGVGGATGDTSGAAVKAQIFSFGVAATITGDSAANLLIGTPLNEEISGLGGDDTLIGGLGADLLDGGTGDDVALFSSALASYTLADLGSHISVAGPDGSDTLSNIEHLQFADGRIDVNDGSGVFDTVFYLSHNLDIFHAGVNALLHYNTAGFHEGRDPNEFFDTSGYLAVNKDVAAAGINPLEHFHQTGWKQGRDPGPDFDTTLYLLNNPDVAAAHVDPLEHFLQSGRAEGRQAFAAVGAVSNGFDAQFYLFHNPDVAAAGIDPLLHFNTIGWQEGRNPNAYFDTAGYLSHYTDVAAAGINPLQHYEAVGWTEGRDPSASFDTLGYLAANPDVAAAHVNPLDHFLTSGIFEGRQPVNDGVFF